MDEFNCYGTNIHIKPHIKSKDVMNENGFFNPGEKYSWLYVEQIFGTSASLWIEIDDRDICIELLSDENIEPYTGCKRCVANRFMKKKLKSLQKAGIISGYDPKEIVWRDIYLT